MKNVSLRELMGNAAESELKLSDLHLILGEKLPEIPKNAVGRLRLIRGLQQRFGHGFRNIPGVRGLIKEFDDEVDFERNLLKISMKEK